LAGGHGDDYSSLVDVASAQDGLDAVRQRIAAAARLAGRLPDKVTLIAISKTHPPAAIEMLLEAGQRNFGENRVQEAAEKWPLLRQRWPNVCLHLVGQLQSNKAEQAVQLFDVIHSVDRPALVDALAKASAKAGKSPECFIQVNIGDEPQKGGCAVTALPDLLNQGRAAGLPIVGLMAIPPADREPAPYFALLAELARRHELPQLSMGMSGDFETAVAIGATYVRVGTALFGEREARPESSGQR
jgi:PLP dependent protein